MENQVPFRKDDQFAVMAHVGAVLPVLFREAVDDGFYSYRQSRRLDPIGFPDYSKCCRANMLYDRIAACGRDLCNVGADSIPGLRWKITNNQRSTEYMFGPYIIFRIKRIKKNRKGLTTSVATWRQKAIRSEQCQPVGQMSFPFPENFDYLPMTNRIWLTVAFDLDEFEEELSRVVIGVETRMRWIWRLPLLQAEPKILASLPTPIADRIHEIRQRRSA